MKETFFLYKHIFFTLFKNYKMTVHLFYIHVYYKYMSNIFLHSLNIMCCILSHFIWKVQVYSRYILLVLKTDISRHRLKNKHELFNKIIFGSISSRSRARKFFMCLNWKIQIISWPARLPARRWQRKTHRMVFHRRPFRPSRRIITSKDFPPIRITTTAIIQPCR